MHAASMNEQGRHRKEESGLFKQDDGVSVHRHHFYRAEENRTRKAALSVDIQFRNWKVTTMSSVSVAGMFAGSVRSFFSNGEECYVHLRSVHVGITSFLTTSFSSLVLSVPVNTSLYIQEIGMRKLTSRIVSSIAYKFSLYIPLYPLVVGDLLLQFINSSRYAV